MSIPVLARTLLLVLLVSQVAAVSEANQRPAAPVIEGQWLRPADQAPALPIWGHAQGLRVGLAPTPGPRGLLRIYAPYLEQPELRVINFIAVEPIPAGAIERGLSELEFSQLDRVRGKRFWSAEAPGDLAPRRPDHPVRGQIQMADGVECLTVVILIERFENGAHVYLRLTFRADRPREVGIATYAHEDSVTLSQLIVTATMGNYARLRRLELAGRRAVSTELWPDYRGDGFTPHAQFTVDELKRNANGHAIAIATPDEIEPRSAKYAARTRRHWHYQGIPASQSWRSEIVNPDLTVQVNGRFTYWNSSSPIPGGVSFENFEMVAPFAQGQEFWFAVEPLNPP